MKQTYGSARGVVAVGLFVVIALGVLVPSVEPARAERTNGIMAAMYWVQPAIGEAIVERARLERGMTDAMGVALGQLTRAMNRELWLERHPMAYLDAISRWDAKMGAAHAARVQYVMGRFIVNGTQRGVRAGLMPLSEPGFLYTRRLVGHAASWGMTMDEEFLAARQVNLGTAVVEANRDLAAAVGATQERLGRAILRVVKVQAGYQDAFAKNEEQLTALLGAVERTQARAELLARLEQLDPVREPVSFTKAESVPSPVRPNTMLVAFWSCAIGFVVFFGYFMSVARIETRTA